MAFLKDSGSKKIVDAIRYTAKQNVWNDPEEEVLPEDICTIIGPPGPQGERGPQGEGFSIYKSYVSIEAMNNDVDNVEVGKFVIIAAAGPHPEEDPDNSKLYVRNSEGGFTFVNDLSGSQGIQGPTEWEKITDRPTSLPASDVYDWAKAEEKPSYRVDEIGGIKGNLLAIYNAEDGGSIVFFGRSKAGDYTTGQKIYVEILQSAHGAIEYAAILERNNYPSEGYDHNTFNLIEEIVTPQQSSAWLTDFAWGTTMAYGEIASGKPRTGGYATMVANVYECGEKLSDILADLTFDSGWENLSLNSEFSNYSTDLACKYRRIGKIVELRGLAVNANQLAASTTASYTIGNLPVMCRPSTDVVRLQTTGGILTFQLIVDTSGNVSITQVKNEGASVVLIPANTQIQIGMTFMVD